MLELCKGWTKTKVYFDFIMDLLEKNSKFYSKTHAQYAIIMGFVSKVAWDRSLMYNNQLDWYIANRATGCKVSFTLSCVSMI